MGFESVASIWDLDLTGDESSELLRWYVGDISPSVERVIAARPELTGPPGALEPLGVIAGMVSAMVTRAPDSARLNLPESLDWWKASCLLRGLESCDQEVKSD